MWMFGDMMNNVCDIFCFFGNSVLKPSTNHLFDSHFHLQERRAAARLPGYFAPLEAAKLEVFVCHVVD